MTPPDEARDLFPEDATASRVAAGIDHPKKRATLAALARTGNVSAACRASGIARRTHYEWAGTDPDYAAAVEQAREEAIEVLEAVARRRAINGSDTMLIFMLKSLRPAVYRERYEVEHRADITLQRQIAEMRAGLHRILEDPDLCRRLEEQHLGTGTVWPHELPPPKET